MDNREDIKRECVRAYQDTGPADIDFFIQYDLPTCGQVWNAGAKVAQKLGHDYVHMTADDLIPHPGWYEAAVETVDDGLNHLPGAYIYRPDGSIETFGNQIQEEWARLDGGSVPFCRTADWIDIPNIHYWSDNAYDYAQMKVNNYSFVARQAYAFTHYSAEPGRKIMDQVERTIFEDWKKTL